jgi:NitT/TauT family transport system permease protein
MARVSPSNARSVKNGRSWATLIGTFAGSAILLYGIFQAALLMVAMPASEWGDVAIGVGATLLRVVIALIIALAWTIPVGVMIGTNPRLAALLQPLVQVTASVPATAIFPVFVMLLIGLPGGLNLAAVLLMLMGTQWYLLFNIIAGANAIPQDLKYTARLIPLNGWDYWRTLILPALFPYLITGMITASGGAWNASIVSEYVTFGGQTLKTVGIGSLIAQATADGNYPLLLTATVSMIVAVILINRLFWRRLYQIAEDRYRME